MKKFFLLILLFASAQLFSQNQLPQAAPDQPATPAIQTGKINTTVQLGGSFTSFSGSGSAFSSYLMPELSTNISKRFRLSGGLGYINTNFSNFQPYFSENKFNTNISTGIVYLSGQYLLNNRITLAGTAYKTFDISGNSGKYPFMSTESKGFNMNIDYKVAEGFHIQAGFNYNEGANPYAFPGSSMFGNDPFGYNSPFSRFP